MKRDASFQGTVAPIAAIEEDRWDQGSLQNEAIPGGSMYPYRIVGPSRSPREGT